MARLSTCIFEWDADDFHLLMTAKKNELINAGVFEPSYSTVKNSISKDELAKHCRRRTRGAERTTELIEALLLSLSTATDSLGVLFLREHMKDIWAEQKHHVQCLQDPPSIQLYTITGYLTKSGVRLPILHCARGSTSLESFHLHLARFIPGTRANVIHFQAFLLDSITCWNADRVIAASPSVATPVLRTYNPSLVNRANTSTWHHHLSII